MPPPLPKMLRLPRWTNNAFVLAPLFFAGRLGQPARPWPTLETRLGLYPPSSASERGHLYHSHPMD